MPRFPSSSAQTEGTLDSRKPMRLIEIFNHYTQPGGESAVADRIIELLRARPDVDIRRASASSADWLGPDAPPRWQQALRTFSNPRFRCALRRMHADQPADFWLAHNVFPVASAGVYAEALRLRVPVVQFLHNWRPFSVSGSHFIGGRVASPRLQPHLWRESAAATWRASRLQTFWLGLVLAWLRGSGWLDAVRAWIAISEFARDRFIEAGFPPERVFALRHFHPMRHAPPPPADAGHYLFLGRLIPEKGVVTLLDAWRHLRRERGPATPPLIVCGSGPLEPLVRAAQEQDPAIRLAGWVEGSERQRLIDTCRAVLVPSVWWEPLGLVVHEAFDAAKPVLAAASGGLRETVIDGRTGMLHPPGNAGALARQVAAIDADPETRIAMGRAGRAWLAENATPDQWLDRFHDILKIALS